MRKRRVLMKKGFTTFTLQKKQQGLWEPALCSTDGRESRNVNVGGVETIARTRSPRSTALQLSCIHNVCLSWSIYVIQGTAWAVEHSACAPLTISWESSCSPSFLLLSNQPLFFPPEFLKAYISGFRNVSIEIHLPNCFPYINPVMLLIV